MADLPPLTKIAVPPCLQASAVERGICGLWEQAAGEPPTPRWALEFPTVAAAERDRLQCQQIDSGWPTWRIGRFLFAAMAWSLQDARTHCPAHETRDEPATQQGRG